MIYSLPKTCSSTYKMSPKIYVNLLILYGILCQGTLGTLSGKDIDKPSELLNRQKRVINRAPGQDKKEVITDFPYIVIIRPYRVPTDCVGAIIGNNIVITVAQCVASNSPATHYRVYSGTARTVLRGGYTSHNVTNKLVNIGGNPFRPSEGIALISVHPPFTFSRKTQDILLYDGFIHPRTLAIVSGWGCHAEGHPGTANPDHLRSITVPIISKEDCAALYGTDVGMIGSNICTLDSSGNRYCGVHDIGAPLIVEINGVHHLVGLHLANGRVAGRLFPDIFINLLDPRYKSWIVEKVHVMEE